MVEKYMLNISHWFYILPTWLTHELAFQFADFEKGNDRLPAQYKGICWYSSSVMQPWENLFQVGK